MQDLDRNLGRGVHVLGQVHRSHASGAQMRDDSVALIDDFSQPCFRLEIGGLSRHDGSPRYGFDESTPTQLKRQLGETRGALAQTDVYVSRPP